MARKRKYTCEDLAEGGQSTGLCRDFYPSLTPEQMSGGRGRDPARYRDFQEKCAESAREGTDYYSKHGCKRSAHRMLPRGRSAVRYGQPEATRSSESGLSYAERLNDLRTPLRRRTQPPEDPRDKAPVIPIQSGALNRVTEILTRATAEDPDGQRDQLLGEEFSRVALPRLEKMAQAGIVDPERLKKFAARIERTSGDIVVFFFASKSGPPSGLAARTSEALEEFNKRLSNTLTSGGRSKSNQPYSVLPSLLGGEYKLTVDIDRARKPPSLKLARSARIVAVNGNTQPFRILASRAREVDPPKGQEQTAAFGLALILYFFKVLSDSVDAKNRVALTVATIDGGTYTFPSVSLRGLQHSDVLRLPDSKRKNYYTFRSLSKRDVAEYLLGLAPKKVHRKKRRGRYLPPLAKENPVAKPSFIDINAYADLEPGQLRPIPTNPRYCVYRKIVKSPASREEEFHVTTCARARSWQKLNQVNQVARQIVDAEDAASLNPMEAPMARSRRNSARNNRGAKPFDPLAELMKEFGSSARLGKSIKRGAPRFDAPVQHGADPYAITKRAHGQRISVPTNRRNPRRTARMNPAQADFASKSRQAAELMRSGMSRKEAWAALSNPSPRRGRHDVGPFTMDYESPYEQVRGPYEGTPSPNRRNPSYRSMKGAQLEALSNRGDAAAVKEIRRRRKKRR